VVEHLRVYHQPTLITILETIVEIGPGVQLLREFGFQPDTTSAFLHYRHFLLVEKLPLVHDRSNDDQSWSRDALEAVDEDCWLDDTAICLDMWWLG
jgi:hypothetical protein